MYSRGFDLNAHDWIQLVQSAGDYLLADLYPDDGLKMDAIYSLLDVCNRILSATSAADMDNSVDMTQLYNDTVEALVKVEAIIPPTELAVMFHVLLHVPDCIYRWNSARNYWAFFGERCMGYFIRFVHNKDLAAENIMTAYVRLRVILASAPGSILTIKQRLLDAGFALPSQSLLFEAADFEDILSTIPGTYQVAYRESRRNTVEIRDPTNSVRVRITQAAWRIVNDRSRELLRELAPTKTILDNACFKARIKGVWMNGKHYKQGSHVLYLPLVPTTQRNQAVGSSASYKIGTIRMIYSFGIGQSQMSFVDIEPRPVLNRVRSLYVVKTLREETQTGFQVIRNEGRVHKTLIHLDQVTNRIMLCPHFDEELRTTQQCGITMWEAR